MLTCKDRQERSFSGAGKHRIRRGRRPRRSVAPHPREGTEPLPYAAHALPGANHFFSSHRLQIIVIMLICKHGQRKIREVWGFGGAGRNTTENGVRYSVYGGPGSARPTGTTALDRRGRRSLRRLSKTPVGGRCPHRPTWRTPTGRMGTSVPTILYRKKFVGAIHKSPLRISCR